MPDLTEKEIVHFQNLYKHYYGQQLTIEEAKVKIIALVDLLRLVIEYECSINQQNDNPKQELIRTKKT